MDDVIENTLEGLLDCVKNEINCYDRSKQWVYMVPSVLRDLSPTSFNPRIVSIGPLHREDANVQAFEKIKIICLIDLMRLTKSPLEEILESCVRKVYASMDQIKAYYVWPKTYGDAEVAKMMVMDACFILRYILRYWVGSAELFIGYSMLIQLVRFDLLLLENQIPFFLLDEIFQCTVAKIEPNIPLLEFILPLLRSIQIFKGSITIKNISNSTTPHILSLLHECYKPQDSNKNSQFVEKSIISPAVDLHNAGVKFKPNQNPSWVLGMEVRLLSRFQHFCWSWSKTTLKMPILVVGDSTEMIFRNLIAYEQMYQTDNYITSYAYVMDMLVNTQEDVVKLVESRVLVNYMGSNEEVANMINRLCKEVVCGKTFYEEQLAKLIRYYNSYWPKHIARMRRVYFSSPWNIIALLAGTFLFVLTVVQTIFTVVQTIYTVKSARCNK